MNIIDPKLQFKDAQTKRGETKKIVLHHALATNASIFDVHKWHLQNGWIGCGYHFYVRKDGSVFKGREIDSLGAHCLDNNHDSIGICAEGNYMKEKMPDAQRNAIVQLIKHIFTIYGDLAIGGHKDYSPSDCPGVNFPKDEIIKLARQKEVQQRHWAQDAFDRLNAKGIKINETRFDDKLTRAELFVLLDKIVK